MPKLLTLLLSAALACAAFAQDDLTKPKSPQYVAAYKALRDSYVAKFGHDFNRTDMAQVRAGIPKVIEGKKFEWEGIGAGMAELKFK